jgi:hypothetical protein
MLPSDFFNYPLGNDFHVRRFFDAVEDGSKPFEVRISYETGDYIELVRIEDGAELMRQIEFYDIRLLNSSFKMRGFWDCS